MSKARGSGGGRRIDPDEADLWSRTAAKFARVKVKPRVATSAVSDGETGKPAPPASPRAKPEATAQDKAAKPKSRAPAKIAPAARAPAPPPLADLDRRKTRQIASGKVAVDAKLDLHGAYQREARVRLRGFLVDAQARGCRTVLVVTGKGSGDAKPDRLGPLLGEKTQRGVLRHNVPLWLAEADLRTVVLGFTQAAPNHGGAGALYVKLRKSARD